MKFKVGDKVKLRKDSKYYDSQNHFSKGTYGVVNESPNGNFKYEVLWSDEELCYNDEDLEFWGYPINDLNKLIYPDYIEKDGLLVPKDSDNE